MKRGKRAIIISFSMIFILTGCAVTPKGFLKPAENYMENRQLQMRKYDTADEEKVISAVAGVLQDLSFNLDSSETKIGLVTSSTMADATDAGQITAAVMTDLLCAMCGVYSNNMALCDKEQKVKASVIIRPSLEDKNIIVRATFQRIVWNMQDQVSRIETIKDPEIYDKFFTSLSKSIFLEAHKI